MSKKLSDFNPNIAISPGETIKEILQTQNISINELAIKLSISFETLSEIIKGNSPITTNIAYKLEEVFKLPASFWRSLEENYQETKSRLNDEIRILEAIPYKALSKLGWIPAAKDKHEIVQNLRKFFSVSSLDFIPSVQAVAFRVQVNDKISSYSIASWLRIGEILAQKIPTDEYSEKRIRDALPRLRSLTKVSPSIFHSELVDICAACGIAFITVPHLPRTYINGAVKWLNNKKALMQLSLRSLFADVFWFSFFHELGHVILHGKNLVFLELSDTEGNVRLEVKKEYEDEANEFAANVLIPPEEYKKFLISGDFSIKNIITFAQKINIDTSIVIGRLQHDNKIPYNVYNQFRRKFKWKINDY